jgi:cytochrome c5
MIRRLDMTRLQRSLVLLTGVAVVSLSAEAASALVLKSISVTLPESTARFPPGPGADIANSNCLACHSVGMVMNQPVMSKAAWEAEVNKMRNVYKAPVDQSDVPAITDYLASIKGPK